jgi:hypothetical protein
MALILQLQCDAIDWNLVAEFWANERGCRAEDLAPGILAAAKAGGWREEGPAQEPVEPGVCEGGFEKWRCANPGALAAPPPCSPFPLVTAYNPANECLVLATVLLPGWRYPARVCFMLAVSDAEEASEGMGADWTHVSLDGDDTGSVHREAGEGEEGEGDVQEENPYQPTQFPGSPYLSTSMQSPHQPGTPGIALSRASSMPTAGMGLVGCDVSPPHGSRTPATGICQLDSASASYGPPVGGANVDAPGAFMLVGGGVGFSSLSTVGFSGGGGPGASGGGGGTAVLQGSSFAALPGSLTSPLRSRPLGTMVVDGFEEFALDSIWNDPLKDSLWQCGQV